MLCEYCNEMICDKCLIENHQGHKTEDYKVANSNDFMINIISNFYTQIRKNNDEQLKNFKDKIYDVDKIVESFFNEELLRVEKTTKDLINLLNNLNIKVKKLIAMYQQKFKEEFVGIKDEYDKFQEEMIHSKRL
jgi:tRNA 2-selenouridine synthase SelU